MALQELPPPPAELRHSSLPGWSRLDDLFHSIAWSKREGVTYASGTWGYTVLRTAHSAVANDLWPSALDKLHRWVSRYFIHYERMGKDLPNGTIDDELGRRFALEVVDVDPERVTLPNDLTKATQEDIKALDAVFEEWVCRAIGAETAARFQRRYNPRFWDFLVVDEKSLRSLAELPDETPPVQLVSLRERLARKDLYVWAYVWLVDSQAVRRFRGFTDAENYNGLMKLSADSIDSAWFARLLTFEDDHAIFNREEFPKGSGELWYTSA
ncbi:hypothetical protein VTI74DRAFT_4673 [Chaetomium olivicolor]